jgi:hypothetical protein
MMDLQATSHADRVRENYRKQGEKRIIDLLLDRINENPSLTIDYMQYLLESLKK